MKTKLKVWQVVVLVILGAGALCTGCVACGVILSTMGVFLPPAQVNDQMVQVYAQQTYASQAGEATQIPAVPAIVTVTQFPTLKPIATQAPTAIPAPPTPALPAIGMCAGFNERVLARVVNVVDGDTIDVVIGEKNYKVRYIGMNTPERGEANWQAATNFNSSLVKDQVVTLVKDVSETDSFGRLLRYVFVRDLFVNYELVRQGYATAISYPPDTACDFTFQTGQLEAQASNVGMWAMVILPTAPVRLPPTAPVFVPPTQPPVGGGGTCNCSRGDYLNCDDFGSQASAQACFNSCRAAGYGDVFRLDRDHDGLACED